METVKCVVVGDGCTGKTCLLVSYTTNTFPGDYVPTIFDNHMVNLMVGGKIVSLGLWDTAGQDDYDRLRPLAYPGTDVFIITYGIDSPTSLKNVLKKWGPEVNDHSEDAKIILVGNKLDTREDAKSKNSTKKYVTKEEADEVANTIGAYKHFEVSALTQQNVEELFQEATKGVLEKRAKKEKKKKAKCTIL
mmetsp:Transcript_3281/g.4967  ORF Transcript_3281/g.4967 Transcript_3281/m.4967 type:complete len:191 (-) Transcript_3281:342-914(-)